MINNEHKICFVLSVIITLLFFAFSANAYVRSSSNYRIDKDSINTGGTEDSSSANYNLRDTIGESGTGESQSANYIMQAGYRQMDEVYLTISVSPATITLTPNIGGLTGGTANGNGTWTIKTDNAAGYNLNIKASTSPALHFGANNFVDYTPASAATPDYNWSLAGVNSEFGFSPYNSASQVAKFKNDNSNCDTGSNITDSQCWFGLTTTNEQIVDKTSRTTTAGEDTKINFRAEVNSSAGFQIAGNYIATIVVTAVSN